VDCAHRKRYFLYELRSFLLHAKSFLAASIGIPVKALRDIPRDNRVEVFRLKRDGLSG
jgi:hypothetical protein